MDGRKSNPLPIDLNEVPLDPVDSYEGVLGIHGAPAPAEVVPAAQHPGEAGVAAGAVEKVCGVCGGKEVRGATVVCDGCERGFHLRCLRERDRVVCGDWVCEECALMDPTKVRWALGARSRKRTLDLNQPPPVDGDSCEELRRVNDTDEDFLNGGFREDSPCQNAGVTVNSGGHTGRVPRTMLAFSEATPKNAHSTGTSFGNLILDSSLGGRPAVNPAATGGLLKEELFLHSLRDFISEKGGVLSEGWHVEIKQSPTGSDSYAVYCAPDGMKFVSMFEVARCLGISFDSSSMDIDERSDECGILQRSLTPQRQKEDLKIISTTQRVSEREHSMRNMETETASQYSGVKIASRFPNPFMEENGVHGSENSVGLPVQYGDFFITSLGKVDLRTAYHDKYHIWPLGYRSSWHDKITGSLFECEVSDGGNSGPVFRVRRCSCSSSSIPYGATILIHNKDSNVDTAEKTGGSVIFDTDYNKDEDILSVLADPSPSKQDFLSCLGHDTSGNSYGSYIQMDKDCRQERDGGLSGQTTSLRDGIGEFYVEGRSSSSAWKMVAHTLIDSCHEVYKQTGILQFCCKHDGVFSTWRPDDITKDVGQLARFDGASGPILTQVIHSDGELEESCTLLKEWLEQDRFGLDIGFVQEIVETLPASRACSGYQFLNERSNFPSSCMVGSGLLLATQKNAESGYEEVVSYGLYSGRHPPPGRPLSSNLPVELVGDIFQISELLWRFYEILGLQEPFSFQELEEELIDPWPCSANNLSRVKREQLARDQASLENENANSRGSLHNITSELSNEQNQFRLIPVDTSSTREAAQDKVAAHTYGRCTGITLTKIHISLLNVLVGELVTKVATYMDLNLGSRESKSRRERKEVVNSFHKELLSLNELTWPELARRYILAVISMKGRTEFQEVFGRECVKLFRCLQGDGGVLCGSLPGIAGMEVDSLLLAEAERQIVDTSKSKNDVLTMGYKHSEEVGTTEPAVTISGLSDWVKELEPVRILPTNVGIRIKQCVESALQKDPPEWAKKGLIHSISKTVYKGSAAGPTKTFVFAYFLYVD